MDQIKVELQEWMGSDRSIAEAAWTSSTSLQGKETKTDDQVKSLVARLATEKHATPFESVVLRFWIKLPVQADRQHMTHRIASHNGMSGRYRTMPDEWQQIPDDVLKIYDKITPLETEILKKEYNNLCRTANDFYRNELYALKAAEQDGFISNSEYKRAREFLRGVLPQNNMTERITIFNLRSFANYQKLRNSEHAQPEIRRIAQLMLEQVKKANICPIALEALEKNGWNI